MESEPYQLTFSRLMRERKLRVREFKPSREMISRMYYSMFHFWGDGDQILSALNKLSEHCGKNMIKPCGSSVCIGCDWYRYHFDLDTETNEHGRPEIVHRFRVHYRPEVIYVVFRVPNLPDDQNEFLNQLLEWSEYA